jgi:hypothetical protein
MADLENMPAFADEPDTTTGGDSGADPAEDTREAASDTNATDVAPPADGTGDDDTSTDTDATSAPAAAAAPPGYVPVDALRAERKARQELERKEAYLRGQLEARQPQKPEEPTPEEPFDAAEFYSNPDQYVRKAAAAEAARAVQAERQRDFVEKANRSAERAAAKYSDYQDVEADFARRAQSNPAIVQQLRAADDPAEFAYSWTKRQQAIEALGDDPKTWIEAERERIRKEVLEEQARAVGAAGITQKPRPDGRSVGPPPADRPLSEDTMLDDLSARY